MTIVTLNLRPGKFRAGLKQVVCDDSGRQISVLVEEVQYSICTELFVRIGRHLLNAVRSRISLVRNLRSSPSEMTVLSRSRGCMPYASRQRFRHGRGSMPDTYVMQRSASIVNVKQHQRDGEFCDA